jgi:hypothetical protein
METQAQTVGSAHWIQTPEQAEEALRRSLHPTLPPEVAPGNDSKSTQAWNEEAVINNFVNIVKTSPKVWAVCADRDSLGVLHIWTYVDSTDRRDRSPVYRAEWQMLRAYPDVPFDFDVVLLPAAKGQSEIDEVDCVYRR